jgi:hypothetical protein
VHVSILGLQHVVRNRASSVRRLACASSPSIFTVNPGLA